MKIVAVIPPRPKLVRIADLALGECAYKDRPFSKETRDIIVRLAPCNVQETTPRDEVREPVLVANLKTNRCWFTEGDQLVEPVKVELHFEARS